MLYHQTEDKQTPMHPHISGYTWGALGKCSPGERWGFLSVCLSQAGKVSQAGFCLHCVKLVLIAMIIHEETTDTNISCLYIEIISHLEIDFRAGVKTILPNLFLISYKNCLLNLTWVLRHTHGYLTYTKAPGIMVGGNKVWPGRVVGRSSRIQQERRPTSLAIEFTLITSDTEGTNTNMNRKILTVQMHIFVLK